MIEPILREIGLTEYESKIYLALLEIGESSSGEILNKAQIQTGKIYQILESLKNKGFVTEIDRDKVKKFFPVNPQNILEFLDRKKKIIAKQEEDFQDILPRLLSRINSLKEETHIEVYTGFKGMKIAFSKEISRYGPNKELLINGIIDYSKHDKKMVDYFLYTIFSKRENSKIKVRKIIDINAKENEKEKMARTKTLSYNSHVTYNVLEDLVIISIWLKEPIFLTIEGKEAANSFKENFEILWEIAKK